MTMKGALIEKNIQRREVYEISETYYTIGPAHLLHIDYRNT
jgi:hypothetical protein